MSYENFEKALQLIEDHQNLVDGSRPNQREDLIMLAEKELKIKFPNSYRFFLKKFGYLGFGGTIIYGILGSDFINSSSPDMVWKALKNRQQFGLPDKYIIIGDLGNGFDYALDVSQINKYGESPVKGSYAFHDPNAEIKDCFEDFGDFLLDQIQQELECQEDE